MVLDLTKYDYVKTYFFTDEDPELSDPEVMQRFLRIRKKIEREHNILGYAKEYGMTMDAEQVANYLKLSKSSVYDLKKKCYILPASMTNGEKGDRYMTGHIIDYVAKRFTLAEKQISYQRG